jgi:hypothetical protein
MTYTVIINVVLCAAIFIVVVAPLAWAIRAQKTADQNGPQTAPANAKRHTAPTTRRRFSRPVWLVISASLLSTAAFATTAVIASAASTHTAALPGPSALTEHFLVNSTKPAGPGVIIVTGPINAGGLEHPGQAIDHASFADGSFRIDHSTGHPTTRFDPKTFVGTISQTGPFRAFDGTGRFSHFNGTGVYRFAARYTTAHTATGCTKTMTAYIERINGTIHIASTPSP